MDKDIVIFSARVAKDLIRNNFHVIDIQQNKQCKLKTVFYFKDTEKTRNYLERKHNIKIK
ncbi:hypothetical protein FYJ27_08535 [Anaerosalibacter bizertensis]|uniref:DUF5659 domain-containing protein n=2 Tax=Anaerosalibacter bizertensis TaxID=932217 RepID=A0A844FI56_9FIRM|nr:hypothetical protein [Anaerosalibacter bizertensis]